MEDFSHVNVTDDRVLVRLLEVETVTAGGIHIATTVKRQKESKRGVVVRVGPGPWAKKRPIRLPMSVKEGDVVVFGMHSGIPFKLEDGDDEGIYYQLMREYEIAGILEEVPDAG